jgi:glucose-6-phosphate 1-dehydrogenase
MSMPLRRDVKSIRREKGNILSALRYPEEACNIVVGQYENYRDQKGVKKDSKTPTFAAIRCMIDLTKWYGIPIYIRTGKRMSHKHTYIAVEFKAPPYAENHIQPNRLVVELYPNEKMELHMVNDSESLACEGDNCLPSYAGLILDAFTRRYESFLSIDEILASWHFIDSISKCIGQEAIVPITYKNGTNGPKEQEKLTAIDNFKWYDAHNL